MFNISRRDIVWGYFAQFFAVASGVITLPLILRLLTKEEIGMNYLMITIGSLVSLFDFGFGPQVGRNITYIFSGAKNLRKEGLSESNENREVDYRLLAVMIHTAKAIFQRIALFVLGIMLTFGTYYIYLVTKGFTSVNNSLLIWIVYCISTFFNLYYSYYTSLLTGKGLITESRKATVYSKILYIILTYLFLGLNLGLLGVALANLISPFLNRFISYSYFFTKAIKKNISEFSISKSEKNELFNIIWFNAKKIGLISVASSSLSYLAMFIIGLNMSLADVASYGLMMQLTGIIATVAITMFYTYLPKMSYLYVQNRNEELKKELAKSLISFYILYFLASVLFVEFGSFALELVGSNTHLPNKSLIALFLFFTLFEKNQSLFSQVLLFENKVPFLNTSIVTGLIATILVYLALILNLGFLGIILAQGIPTMVYSAWKWPFLVCEKLNISYKSLFRTGFLEIKNLVQNK